MLESVTPLILTWNESPNIARCIERLHWATRIVVIDSGSTDGTADLALKFSNVEVVVRKFDNHTAQWNFGISQINTPWVLSLDADYIVPDSIIMDLSTLSSIQDISPYYAGFRYLSLGRPLGRSLYPPRAVLFKKDKCQYEPDGHTQKLAIEGETSSIKTIIDHDDRKSLSRWLTSQDSYARLEAAKLLQSSSSSLSLQDRLRMMLFVAPVITPLYVLFFRGVLFDGWPGFYYVLQRTLADIILSMHLIEARLKKVADSSSSS